jgi:ABC-type Fe3+ transport system substrate-binding protein
MAKFSNGKGQSGADIFWGGESVHFYRLAEQKLLAKLDLPQAITDWPSSRWRRRNRAI